MLFVSLIFGVVILVSIKQPLQAIAGVVIVLAGLPVHHFLARRNTER